MFEAVRGLLGGGSVKERLFAKQVDPSGVSVVAEAYIHGPAEDMGDNREGRPEKYIAGKYKQSSAASAKHHLTPVILSEPARSDGIILKIAIHHFLKFTQFAHGFSFVNSELSGVIKHAYRWCAGREQSL